MFKYLNLKKFLYLLIVISVLGITSGHKIDIDGNEKISKVLALPEGYDPRKKYEPYRGAHPSNIIRPAETFNFPVKQGELGPVQPLFAGPLEYPFLCQTEEAGFEQPVVDNYSGEGIAIYEVDKKGRKTDKIVGYSKDCSLPTRVFYMYKDAADKKFYVYDGSRQDINIEELVYIDKDKRKKKIKFIVRVEAGTINRHIYLIYALKGTNEKPDKPVADNWNGKLIYQFRGGVGIGKRQGKFNLGKLMARRETELAKGYAIVHSTANQTSNHYNIWLSEDTALRVKQQFVSQYGEPEYTLGLGGSGGAIQQYLLAQNNNNILDGALAIYSYPDMLSQTTYVLDCELLEYYFDRTDAGNSRWKDWKNRSLIEGMSSRSDKWNRYAFANAAFSILNFKMPRFDRGMSECVNAWRGLTPLILNPHFPHVPDRLDEMVQRKTYLTYWDNLKYFYGTDKNGIARVTWDNTGVQYGLRALRHGEISLDEFIHLNAHIGGWKKPLEMRRENFWVYENELFADTFSVWSEHNMHRTSDTDRPARRNEGDLEAIQAAYRSGQVFIGKIDIPVIDLRHYLDEELDMHHSFTSFSSRSRLLKHQGHYHNHVIWMTEKPHTPISRALEVLGQWVEKRKQGKSDNWLDNRPVEAVDACFNGAGELVSSGKNVWNGEWNNRKPGDCSRYYPPYRTSRMIAGDKIAGDVFKCQLQSVEQAISKGVYGKINMNLHKEQLQKIFPAGVCDYTKGDMGRPENLLSYKALAQ